MALYPADVAAPNTGREQYILERCGFLKTINDQQRIEQWRIRTILDGGTAGVQALLGAKAADFDIDELALLPIPDLMGSGIDRFAHRLGRMPTTRVEPPQHIDRESARRRASKMVRIVDSYDEANELEMLLPQMGRWVPGYGYTAIVVTERHVDARGRPVRRMADAVYHYPVAELRDPYETLPGVFGARQQPVECAFMSTVDHKTLAEMYPGHKGRILGTLDGPMDEAARGWANRSGNGLTVVEYRDIEGTWICVPEKNLVLEHIPNLLSRPTFVVVKRFSFNQLKGHFDRAVGLMSGMAVLNLLTQAAVEDEVFAETNLSGDVPEGFGYDRGRGALNILPPGVTAARLHPQFSFQVGQQVKILEQQFRQTTRYSAQSDGESPQSFATGRGLEELASGMEAEVREYQTAFRRCLQHLDSLMLEWDETYCPGSKPLVGWKGDEPFAEKYDPAVDIKGSYRTKRVYGAMSTLDDAARIAALLNLNGTGLISDLYVLENLDGLENVEREIKRVRHEQALEALRGMLAQKASEGDPAAVAVLIDMLSAGDDKVLLETYFTPREPELDPAMAEFLNPAAPPPAPGAGLPLRPPPVATTLARSMAGDSLGAQLVGRAA